MGTIRPHERGTVVPIMGDLPANVLGEVRVHQHIYRRRPDVGGVCRVIPPKVVSLSVLRRTPKPRHLFGAYFSPPTPLWEDPSALRSDDLAGGAADALGNGRAVVLLGNGAVTVGPTLVEAVAHAWFLEDAARVELDVLRAGVTSAFEFTHAQAESRAVPAGRGYERLWDFLCDGDPE
jgi:HCOMODA/2-hydroxy-3-carboxy-muconic semialdehyde decarboxylase